MTKHIMMNERKIWSLLKAAKGLAPPQRKQYFQDEEIHKISCQHNQSTALHLIANYNEMTEFLEPLIELGADVNAIQYSQKTPLHLAALHGHPAVAKMLLDCGACIDAQCKSGATPIILSAEFNHLESSLMLLKAGANVNIVECRGTSPLHYAGWHGNTVLGISLLQCGADFCAPDMDGLMPGQLSENSVSLVEPSEVQRVQSWRSNMQGWLDARSASQAIEEMMTISSQAKP